VHVVGEVLLAQQRPVGAGVHRSRRPAEVARVDGVLHAHLQRHVARHDGDREDVDVVGHEGEDQRDGVVGGGVRVDDHAGHAAFLGM
jgi:hypothetical protein